MTQRERFMVENYFNSHKTELSNCYKNCSTKKHQIYEKIRTQMSDDCGWRFRIVSHNSYSFTCAYLCVENYNEIFLKYFTSKRTYKIKLDDETRERFHYSITSGY